MTKPIVTMIRHHQNAVELADNAAIYLSQRGYNVHHRYPVDGDLLALSPNDITPTIILGGSQNITDLRKHPYLENELHWIDACLAADVPVIGICLGGQLLAHTLGAEISARDPEECEFGFYEIQPTAVNCQWLKTPMHVMQAHFQEFSLPQGAEQLASSHRFKQQAFRYGEKAYGLQFHPEVNDSILKNWLQDDWSHEMLATLGAQSVDEQFRLGEKYLDQQNEWFVKFLEELFVRELAY